jgi:hypothetical protein
VTLTLPSDAEVFIPEGEDFDWLHNAGVYALTLSRADDLAAAWDRHFEHRPDYFADLRDAEQVVYVGAAKDLLARLTDHKDGEKRVTVLTEVCEIDGLRNVWFCEETRRFVVESQTATMMQNEHPAMYVHSR